jgi:hypothetical protein
MRNKIEHALYIHVHSILIHVHVYTYKKFWFLIVHVKETQVTSSVIETFYTEFNTFNSLMLLFQFLFLSFKDHNYWPFNTKSFMMYCEFT